jgi:hypothetical protein
MTPDEIEAEFAAFTEETLPRTDRPTIHIPQPDEVYDFEELKKVDGGDGVGALGDMDHSHLGSGAGRAWNVEGILTMTGVKLD